MKLVVGLGNPGKKYEKTRHNFGFRVIDCLGEKLSFPEWEDSKKFHSLISRKGDLILAKPQAIMNNSGKAVRKLVNFYKVNLSNLWIIHDDVDLPLGRIKVQPIGRGGSTHKGVVSIVKDLGFSKFPRFRLGIAGKGYSLGRESAEKYVLKNFSTEEERQVKNICQQGSDLLAVALERGVQKAQSCWVKT